MSIVLKNGAYAFLFNADDPELGLYYGYPCDKALFDSVLKSNKIYPILSILYCGDMLLHNLCDQIRKVERNGNITSSTYTVERDLYITLVTELAQSIKNQFNTISKQDLPLLLAKKNIYCIVITHLSFETMKIINDSINGAPGYIGTFELDLGNPIHIILFIERLIQIGFLNNSELYLKKDYEYSETDEEIIPDWAKDNPLLTDVYIINSSEYNLKVPSFIIPPELSKQGKIMKNIFDVKGKPDHYQKIAYGLQSSKEENYNFIINDKLSFDKIIVPQEKLTEYALNPEHNGSGKSKAKLFKELLGITKKDWRYLSAQITNGLTDGALCNVRKTEHGIQYHIDMPVKGLNGVSKTVRTGWITKDSTTISLTTVYIVDKNHQQNVEGDEPLIVRDLDQDLFWETLYNFAYTEAVRASKKVIPTPIYINGYPEPIMEGDCGLSSIIIKDARRGFPKWLRKNKIGNLYYKGGWQVFAETNGQSFERAKAYAETFTKILQQNGVISYRLDQK